MLLSTCWVWTTPITFLISNQSSQWNLSHLFIFPTSLWGNKEHEGVWIYRSPHGFLPAEVRTFKTLWRLLGMPCLKAPRTPPEPSVTALVWKPTTQASSDSSSLPLNKQSQNNHTDARGRWKEHPAHRQLQTSVPDAGQGLQKGTSRFALFPIKFCSLLLNKPRSRHRRSFLGISALPKRPASPMMDKVLSQDFTSIYTLSMKIFQLK